LLEAAGIATTGGRALHILGHLAQQGVICFGARQGKQATFTLLDDWAPKRRVLARDEALAELAERYFTSHGPATVRDFVWWSGLTVADARAGIATAEARLARETIEGQAYWRSPKTTPASQPAPGAHLLPPFDEYTVAYKDRSAAIDPAHALAPEQTLAPTIVVNGRLVGNWRRTIRTDGVVITADYFSEPDEADAQIIAEAAARYGAFLGASAEMR
jgi:hypothetical protein